MQKISKIDIKRFNNPIDETTIYDPLALVVKAKGSKIWIEGEKDPYFDLLMSYCSTNFGHVNEELLPRSGNKIPYYPVGGTKAIDAAIKLAKAYTKKDTIVAFEGAFHGYSYAAMTITDDRYVEKNNLVAIQEK